MSERLRAQHVHTLIELLDWSRCLHRYGPHPCEPVRRYAIGVYQLYQAVDWAGTPSEYESNAAACIHIIAATEAFDIPIEQVLCEPLLDDISFGRGSNDVLLYHISKLQAQLVYATNSSTIRRKSRFDKGIAAASAAIIIRILLGRIPYGKRVQAIYEAMEIMVGVL